MVPATSVATSVATVSSIKGEASGGACGVVGGSGGDAKVFGVDDVLAGGAAVEVVGMGGVRH